MELTENTTTDQTLDSVAFAHPRVEVGYRTKAGPVLGYGRVTIAYQTEEGVARYNVAYCSPNDNFNRRIGRTIASNRLAKNPRTIQLVTEEDVLKTIMGDIAMSALPWKWQFMRFISARS